MIISIDLLDLIHILPLHLGRASGHAVQALRVGRRALPLLGVERHGVGHAVHGHESAVAQKRQRIPQDMQEL